MLNLELSKVVNDPIKFISRLKIINKKGKLVTLKLNGEQLRIIESLLLGRDTLILKPRQIGSTTATAAFFFWQAYVSKDPTTHLILSHKMASSKHIFSMHKTFYESLPRILKKPLSIINTSELSFKDSGASIMAVSSGGDGGVRSFTASSIHLSELAFTPNADELKATAISALNGGQLCIESTANYWGDALQNEISLVDAGMVDYNFLFFKWSEHEEYSLKAPEAFEADHSLDLTKDQQYWAHKMIGKIGASKFKREFPLTMEEAYAQLDGAWINSDSLRDIQVIKIDQAGAVLSKVDSNDKYAVGVDLGGGIGGDFSVIVVLSAFSGQIVEIRRSNTIPPVEWAQQIADVSKKYNNARVLVESNHTLGGTVINELSHMHINMWKDNDGKDWTTNVATKPLMLEHLKSMLISGRINMLDSQTFGELRSFKVDDRGAAFCPRGAHHGDSVIALALAHQCVLGISVERRRALPEWITKQNLANKLKKGARQQYSRY